MIAIVIAVALLWAMCQAREDYSYQFRNLTRTTLPGLGAYRSALTLDWLEQEDRRQRDVVNIFETETPPLTSVVSIECISYARPASGKIARLMLELLKSLEGDSSTLIDTMIQALVNSRLLVETSMLDAEPDLDALVKTPGLMAGEPHTTFPKILEMIWMTVTDPVTTKKFGWCPVQKLTKYLAVAKPDDIAKRMKLLEPVISRVRYVMEEFISFIVVTPVSYSYFDKTLKPLQQRGTVKYRTSQPVLVRTSPSRAPRISQLPQLDRLVRASSTANYDEADQHRMFKQDIPDIPDYIGFSSSHTLYTDFNTFLLPFTLLKWLLNI